MGTTRNTRQRNAILKSIREADGPLSVGEVHGRSRLQIPGLGIATVYRAIKALREDGEVVLVELPGEGPRYEPVGRGHQSPLPVLLLRADLRPFGVSCRHPAGDNVARGVHRRGPQPDALRALLRLPFLNGCRPALRLAFL